MSLYKGKDLVTGYYVYGPLLIQDGKTWINDIECGLIPVEPESVSLDSNGTTFPFAGPVTRTASYPKEKGK